MLISLGTGGVLTAAVSWVQKLPRWLVLSLIFIVASAVVFFGISFANLCIAFVKRKIGETVAESPLKKRIEALEYQVGPRRISPEQREKLLLLLSQCRWKVRIVSVVGDEDAANYAKEFAELLTEAGWNVWGWTRLSKAKTAPSWG